MGADVADRLYERSTRRDRIHDSSIDAQRVICVSSGGDRMRQGSRSCGERGQQFQGHPVWRFDCGTQSLHAAGCAAPWAGVRDALSYGPTAPQNPSSMRGLVDPRSGFAAYGDADGIIESEDCLVLNVWTSDASENRQRPVMVWLHGGGFQASSGSPPIYDGSNLVRRGDVVVVSVNHRLGALGYTFFAGIGGDDFSAARNVGMLDLVAALQWVRDNIAKFGGDPRDGDDLRRVRRRAESLDAARDAVGEKSFSSRGGSERPGIQDEQTRACGEGRRNAADRARTQPRAAPRGADGAGRAHRGSAGRGAEPSSRRACPGSSRDSRRSSMVSRCRRIRSIRPRPTFPPTCR